MPVSRNPAGLGTSELAALAFRPFYRPKILAWLAVQQQEATLAIRPVGQGVSMPDGFSVWHHLDANGIRFKSITPQKDGLLIKFDSTAQGAAAKEVLGRALPHGYIIALLEDDNSPTAWLSRLRDAPHRLG